MGGDEGSPDKFYSDEDPAPNILPSEGPQRQVPRATGRDEGFHKQ
jgi:hypothetical protein